jgi:hypothetical protein
MLAILGLAGCGDDGPGAASGPVPLVEIVTNRLDGEPPDHDLSIRRVEQGALGSPVALTPVPGRPRIYEARGATDGLYVLALPDGWGPLFVVTPPRVSAGAPAKMSAGRPHTIYLTSRLLDRVLGETWAVRRVGPGGDLGPPLPLKVEMDGNGWVLLRMKPEDWAGPVVFQGRFDDRTLTEQVPTTLRERGLPILRQLEPEPAGPLRVVVVGVPAGVERWVHLRVLGLPIEEVQQRPVRDGVAEFPSVATPRGGLELRVGDDPDAYPYRVPSEVWARNGEVRVRDAGPQLIGGLRVPVPGASTLVRAQVRAEADESYGWAPAWAEGDAVVLPVNPGSWRVLVQTQAGFATGKVQVNADGTFETALGPVEPAAKVSGRVTGDTAGGRLVWRRIEDGQAVLAHGFVVGVGQGGAFQVALPPGEYRLELHGPEGARGAPRTHRFEAGEQVDLSLDMPVPR